MDLESYQAFQDLSLRHIDGLLLTYQGASRKSEQFRDLLMSWASDGAMGIADEAHHLGVDPDEPEGQVWGRTFLEITKRNKVRLGLTGTPFRADNLAFCSAKKVVLQDKEGFVEQICPDLCIEPRDLISAGDVRPLEFHFQDGWVEHSREGQPDRDVSPLSAENRESWRARNLRRAVLLSDTSSIALHVLIRARQKLEKVRSDHRNAAGLVIARDIQHATQISNFLQENGEIVELVHSQDRDSTGRLNAFQRSDASWLVSVDMCSEGFDAPRLRVVVYLTTVVTKSRFLQGITRAVRMSSSRERKEPVPRNPSFVFAPADPLLMQHARSWSIAEPYLIRGNTSDSSIGLIPYPSRGPILPMEAVGDGAGEMIKMRTVELPIFLK